MTNKMASTSRNPASTRFFTRRVIFACDHTAERIYPIRDLRGPSFKTAKPPVPMLLALRLPEKCIPCAREAVLDRYRGNAKEVRERMSSLHARLDRILNKADSDDEKDACKSMLQLETGNDEADEAWPDEPPAAETLIRQISADDGGYFSGDDGAGAASTDSDATIRAPKPRPVGKLSTNIRLLREDLDRRMQAWSRTDKAVKPAESKAESESALQLSRSDLDDISSYEAFEAEIANFTVL
ncbi:hypothetical protein F503_02415 [Ophiostoma piceae UAMH 11346]|uniref:Uncharacterized protein n=1 Tax=Ophiostoma piceae (strain UAMH 11346) TaxID=1262450 RepID=S3C0L5_OPHP1|nr:hypothetical protein F503_02415 [Ophiostoma piceae UAMH 11346]